MNSVSLWWLSRQILSPDRSTALSALEKIRAANDLRAVPLLLNGVRKCQDTRARCEAANILGELRDFQAVVPLFQVMLTTGEDCLEEACEKAISTIYPQWRLDPTFSAVIENHVAALLDILRQFPPEPRRVIGKLKVLGSQLAVQPLLDRLAYEEIACSKNDLGKR